MAREFVVYRSTRFVASDSQGCTLLLGYHTKVRRQGIIRALSYRQRFNWKCLDAFGMPSWQTAQQYRK